MTMFFPPQPEPPADYTRPQTYYPPPQQSMPTPGYPYPPQPLPGYYLPGPYQYQQPPPRPINANMKTAAIITFIVAFVLALLVSASDPVFLPISGLLEIVGFVLLCLI